MRRNTLYQYDDSLFCEGLFTVNVKSPVFSYGKKGEYTSKNNEDYRYGFNGMEKDDEVYNTSGSSLDFGPRMLDTRLGRFTSLDPREDEFPHWSPYHYGGNSPIAFIDQDGEGPIIKIHSPVYTALIRAALSLGYRKAEYELIENCE